MKHFGIKVVVVLILVFCACDLFLHTSCGKRHKKQITANTDQDSVYVPQDTLIEYKKISTAGWQKEIMEKYYVLIPPGYAFDYPSAVYHSDTDYGTISKGNFKMYIRMGVYDL